MRNIIFTLVLMALSTVLLAQQEAHYTHFMYNNLSINPAVAGSKGHPSLLALYRKQWVGYDGAPDSKLISFHSPLGKRVGLGLTISNDRIGISYALSGSMAYAYRVKIDEETTVQVGIQGSMKYFGLDFRNQLIRQTGDPSIVYNDLDQKYLGNVGAGIFMNVKQMFFGLSVPNFFPNTIGIDKTTSFAAVEVPHFYITGGALIPLSNDKIALRPSALAKVVKNAPFDLDLNLSLVFNKSFIVGASYRIGGDGIGDSIDFLLHYKTNNIGFGVAYDYTLSELNDYNNGSIEAIMVYDFVKEQINIANPRFFF
ncbi:MAG: type IX secretion system membrane protein PorP/SprF [Saprospiraceae bacterium]|nr:type IX secretion system membrane protein PorP/SprF [Saprospiraceae bacterium]